VSDICNVQLCDSCTYRTHKKSIYYSLESELKRQYLVIVIRLGGGFPRPRLYVPAIVDVSLLFLQPEHDPIMEPRYFSVLHLCVPYSFMLSDTRSEDLSVELMRENKQARKQKTHTQSPPLAHLSREYVFEARAVLRPSRPAV
jgi:hypothetical protein